MSEDKEPDIKRLVTMIQNYTDYQQSLMLTPEHIQQILEADTFDHDNYKHRKTKKTTKNKEGDSNG